MNRRTFLEIAGTAAATAVAGPRAAEGAATAAVDGWAVLVDLTRCVGCRTCEGVCAEANGLPDPSSDADLDAVHRDTSERQYTVVNRHETSRGEVWAKRQCMHCVEPACATACLTKAMFKTPEGPVIWRADKCMGCRYCMISCPFDGPKFEYHSANPRIQKCQLCWSRLQEDGVPACVENCPAEALTFGRRSELLEIARTRIYQNPGEYVSHIYGEREAGGTSILYLSPVPFDEVGFPEDIGEASYPERTRDFLTAVPVVLTLWPAFLLAMRQAGNRNESTAEGTEEH